jgi:ATP-binding cassette, subfamily B (MDR/TAP), member 1
VTATSYSSKLHIPVLLVTALHIDHHLSAAFWRGWALTLVILSAIPALVAVSALIAIFTGKLNARATTAYARAGAAAQEALSNHRTVSAFCAEEDVVSRYDACLDKPVAWGQLQGLLSGLTLGTTHFVFFGAYALALWFGSRKVADGDYTGGYCDWTLAACMVG